MAKPKDPTLRALKEQQKANRNRRDGITDQTMLRVQEGFAKAERDNEAIRNQPVEHKTMADMFPGLFPKR